MIRKKRDLEKELKDINKRIADLKNEMRLQKYEE